MNQSFNGNKHYEIMSAIKTHIIKYKFDIKKTIILLSHLLNGEYEYITREENARETLENYSPEEIRKAIFENIIITEGAMLHNREQSGKEIKEELETENRVLRYAFDMIKPEFAQSHNFSPEKIEEGLEKGLLHQCDNVGKTEYIFNDWYLRKCAENLVYSKAELFLKGEVKTGLYHPNSFYNIKSIRILLNSLNLAYYKREKQKDKKI